MGENVACGLIKKAKHPRKMRNEFPFVKKWILDFSRMFCFLYKRLIVIYFYNLN